MKRKDLAIKWNLLNIKDLSFAIRSFFFLIQIIFYLFQYIIVNFVINIIIIFNIIFIIYIIIIIFNIIIIIIIILINVYFKRRFRISQQSRIIYAIFVMQNFQLQRKWRMNIAIIVQLANWKRNFYLLKYRSHLIYYL